MEQDLTDGKMFNLLPTQPTMNECKVRIVRWPNSSFNIRAGSLVLFVSKMALWWSGTVLHLVSIRRIIERAP